MGKKWLTRLVLGREAVEPDPNEELRQLNAEEAKKAKGNKRDEDGDD